MYTFRQGDQVGACQVIAVGKSGKASRVEIATLDWCKPRAPTPKDKLTVLRATWGAWNGRADRHLVEPRVPWWLEHAFTTAVVEKFDEPTKIAGHWHDARGVFVREAWKRRPKPKKSAAGEVAIDIGGGPRTLGRNARYVTIGDGEWVVPRPKGKARLAALDVLRDLDELHVDGACNGLPAWVASSHLVTLDWSNPGVSKIDLSKSTIEDLRIEVTDDVVVRVPPTLTALTLRGKYERATIEGLQGRFPPLRLTLSGRSIAVPRGVADVEHVTFSDLVDTDTAALSSFPALAALVLRGAPGTISDARGLATLDTLRELELHEMYGIGPRLDPARLAKAWPALDAVRIHGVETTDAPLLKTVFAQVPLVQITGVRTKAWMEATLGNPFREWEEADEDFGRAACAAWKKAKVEVTKLGAKAKKKDAEATLKSFVAVLNRLDAKHGELDTIRREEAAEAFLALAADCGVDDKTAGKWFDGWRDF